MKVKYFLVILSLLFLVSCANNMVLYRDDIKGFDLTLDTLPESPFCDVIQSEYNTGKKVVVAKGTRWVDPVSAEKNRYVCRVGDDSCKNAVVALTGITQERKHILDNCKRAQLHADKKKEFKKEATAQKISDETKRSLAFDYLLEKLLNKDIINHREQQYLDYNFTLFIEELVGEADIADFEGLILLGTSQSVIKSAPAIRYPYQVQQVKGDRVLLECGKCSLPPVGIIRENGRPSPIEGQIFNDTRAIYKFVGTDYYRTIHNERKQMILFKRISMKSLNLPSNYLHEVIPKGSL